MSRTVAYCSLIIFAGVVCAVSATHPVILSDQNIFLKELVSHEIIEILAVIVSITLSSTSILHLELNKIEERYQKRGFDKTRAGIRQAAYWLIALFSISIVTAVAKASLNLNQFGQSLANGIILLILLWNVLILVSITQAVFAVKPHIDEET
ncbi:MAG TPA: hypothetical protein VME40_06395 [Caulobacteraceae bacterium]|nr:hypothetical protein [Caulobacteraceae bacterium]